ncbi:hypothetical protein [Methanococcoides sp. FTZ1]|uniref:hypothetical protein n=1 Tax=Methanococcoides sp. FTZ1 TaxID=3439061 RepID=UPI003F833C99
MINKSVFLSLLVIGVVAASAGTGTWAVISDTDSSEGNTITTGMIDLEVNGGGILDGNDEVIPVPILVEIPDMKPGREFVVTKQLMLHNNPGYVSLSITDLEEDGGELSEPEKEWEEAHPGSEDWGIGEVIVFDLSYRVDTTGNGVINENDAPAVVVVEYADYERLFTMDRDGDVFALGPDGNAAELPAETLIEVYQSFHMNEEAKNWVQGDTCTFTEIFYAEQLDYTGEEPTYIGPNLVDDD